MNLQLTGFAFYIPWHTLWFYLQTWFLGCAFYLMFVWFLLLHSVMQRKFLQAWTLSCGPPCPRSIFLNAAVRFPVRSRYLASDSCLTKHARGRVVLAHRGSLATVSGAEHTGSACSGEAAGGRCPARHTFLLREKQMEPCVATDPRIWLGQFIFFLVMFYIQFLYVWSKGDALKHEFETWSSLEVVL